jgi:hypothetical protein
LLFEIAIANGSMMLGIVTQPTAVIDRVVAMSALLPGSIHHRSFALVCSTENLLTPFSHLSNPAFQP